MANAAELDDPKRNFPSGTILRWNELLRED
jgi:hypothetical protein